MWKRLLLLAALVSLPTSVQANISNNPINTLLSGTTAQRPAQPAEGNIRDNTTLGAVEVYLNGVWSSFSAGLVNLATGVTGTLGVMNGGTGLSAVSASSFLATNGSRTLVSAPSYTYLGTLNLLQDKPTIASDTPDQTTADLQTEFNQAYIDRMNLVPALGSSYDYDVNQSVMCVSSPPLNLFISSPLVIPPHVATCNFQPKIIRYGEVGSAVANWTGAPNAQALANKYQPTVIMPRGSQNAMGTLSLLLQGTDGNTFRGSGLFVGRSWQIATMSVANGGTGYQVGDTVVTAIGEQIPFVGATAVVSSIGGGGAITGLTYTGTLGVKASGLYPLPPYIQSQVWTTANGWNGTAAGPTVFDGSGNYLLTGGSGTGSSVSVTWFPDWCNGTNGCATLTPQVYTGVKSPFFAYTTYLGNVDALQGDNVDDTSALYGNTYSIFINSSNTLYNYITALGNDYGVGITNFDLHGNFLNTVGGGIGVKILDASSIFPGQIVVDTPRTSTFIAVDDVQNGAFNLPSIFRNTSATAPTGTGAAIQVGMDTNYSTASHMNTGNTFTGLALNAGTTSGTPLVDCAYAQGNIFNFDVSNRARSGGAQQYPITSIGNLQTNCDASNQFVGSIDAQSGNLFIGTLVNVGAYIWQGALQKYATMKDSLNITTAPVASPSVDSGGSTLFAGKNSMTGIGTSSAAFNDTAYGAFSMNGTMTTTAVNNAAFGYAALGAITSGSNNAAGGYRSMVTCSSCQNSTAFGFQAANSTNSNEATAFGASALGSSNGSHVAGFGYSAGSALTSGTKNLFLGDLVGSTTLTTGSGNILIGTNSGVDTLANNTAGELNIGNLIYGAGLGTSGTTPTGTVGIGTATPRNSSTLDVNGTVNINSVGSAAATPACYSTSSGGILSLCTGTPFTTAGTGLSNSGATVNSNAVYQISYQPGLVASVTNTKSVYAKVSKATTVDNIEGAASAFSCVSNPTITFFECGTSSTCAASPTTIGTATITAAGQVFDGTINSATITAGDYVAWALTAGTCTSLDISATAQVHSN